MIEGILLKISQMSPKRYLIILCAISGIYYFTSFDDGSKLKAAITKARTELSEMKAKNDEVRKLLDSRERVTAELTELSADFEQVIQSLPSELNEPELIGLISGTVQRSESKMLKISAEKTIDFDFYAALPINVEISGSFARLTTFLSLISKFPRIVRIDTVTISRPTSRGQGPQNDQIVLNGRLLGYRYYADRLGTDEAKRKK